MKLTRRHFLKLSGAALGQSALPRLPALQGVAGLVGPASTAAGTAVVNTGKFEILAEIAGYGLNMFREAHLTTEPLDVPWVALLRYCMQMNMLQTFDLLCADGSKLAPDTRDELLRVFLKHQDKVTHDVIEHLMDRLQDPAWREAKRIDSKKQFANIMQAYQSSGQVREIVPFFELAEHPWLDFSWTGQDGVLNTITDIDLIEELSFFQGFGIWPDKYPKNGAHAQLIAGLKDSFLGRYHADSRYGDVIFDRPVAGLGAEFGEQYEQIENYYDEADWYTLESELRIPVTETNDIKDPQDLFSRLKRHVEESREHIYSDIRITSRIETVVDKPPSRYLVDVHYVGASQSSRWEYREDRFIKDRLTELFGNAVEHIEPEIFRIRVPMLTQGDDPLEKLYGWRDDPARLRRDVAFKL